MPMPIHRLDEDQESDHLLLVLVCGAKWGLWSGLRPYEPGRER